MEKIFNGIDYEVLNKGLDIKYNEIHYDSRKITEGDIFVALSGATVDGHDYIEKSISLGAKLIIVSKNVEIINKDITYVKVVDTRKVLGFIASNFYGYPQNSLKIIGVTGTNGKTTSTYLLERLIGECSRIGTVEYKIGDEIIEAPNTTPESLDLIKMMKKTVDKGIEYFIMEVSSHALEMGRVDMLEFDAAIFTNLTQDHLDYHKDMESYFQAKRKLFLKLKDSKKGVYNIDDSHGKLLFEEFGGISYSIKDGIIKGSIVENKLHSTIFSLEYNGIKRVEEVKILGLFNLYNLMGVMGALINLGYDFEELCNKLGNLVGVPGR
ncbi:MAG: UDP-N-acetylmuramoyl-L-alanyl-D-glutamate--2,6-diaminopimelate ligase, partial [Fusobacteriaceae bacterium]|nr:UDP-N-acetylmuramoyl-L-alanyl-D-glutamate--2,6-diaminopimelate ligase [Fusobacteriaceae bacterium]